MTALFAAGGVWHIGLFIVATRLHGSGAAKRHGVEMGGKVNTLRVMAKPLAGGSLGEYLALVARDRPD